MKVITYTDHTGRRQLYCTIGQDVLGLGELGSLRQCRAWLSHLYHGYPEAIRYAVRETAKVEEIDESSVRELAAAGDYR